MENVILFGGAFDPVHNGHLRMASAASFLLNADVVFVPSKSPRWKDPAAGIDHRLKMLALAIRQNGLSGTTISDFEIHSQAEVNFTIDTIRYFVTKYPKKRFFLLIGADQVNQFHQWREPDEITRLVTVVYIPRPEIKINESNVIKYRIQKLSYNHTGDVSSTKIRNLQSVDMPSEVLDYIEKNRLYYIDKIASMLDKERFDHSISVAHLARSIAYKNERSDYPKAYIAGLLHDLGKGYDTAQTIAIMKRQFKNYVNQPEFSYHQFVGSYLAEKEFGIKDEEILDAIRFHATGKTHMSPLGKIIYSADKIDPLRGFNSRPLIKKCYKNYYLGFVMVLSANREYLIANGKDIKNSLTDACMELYLGKGKEIESR
ncbi:MAG: nicotinate (nicotinamide) nucleotide adenylyltransferase [Bacilli bacterium]|jgi:nicotinate-nucleotide adenylyltransferase